MNRKKNTILPCTCFVALFLFSATPVLGAGLELELSCTNPGTATPGYWMTHPEEWPVDEICIGGVLYSKADAIELMWEPTRGDKTLTMIPALVAAKLNDLMDNYTGCLVEVCDEILTITCVIAKADCWLSANPAPVKASSDAWQDCGEGLYLALDAYNNGELCVDSRDELELELSCTNPGTATPGYWMTHPEEWPVDEICIGGVLYSKADAIDLMWEPTKGDKTLTMIPALVAAKLNDLMDNYTGCLVEVCDEVLTITCVIAKADCWLSANPAPVKASSDAWQDCGEGLYLALDAYNNGNLCVPSRDVLE